MSILSSRAGRWAFLIAGASLLWLNRPGRCDEPARDEPQSQPSVAELVERLRKMEEANQKLAKQLDRIDQQNHDLSQQNTRLSHENHELSDQFKEMSRKLKALENKARPGQEEPDEKDKEHPGEESGYEAPGGRSGDTEFGGHERGVRINPGQEAQIVGNRHLGKLKIKTRYNYDRDGLQFSTEDDELELKFRMLLQAEERLYTRSNQDPVHSGFYVPRARFYFTGHLTKPIEYNVSFQRTYTEFDLVNAYLNFRYDDRLHFRFGRFKTPYTYEYYKLHLWRLPAPERSLFNVNYQGGRQIGAMAWGDVLDRRLEYAVGIFDGPRRSYTDYNNAKDVMAFLNIRPFETWGDSPLTNLNFGGSLDFGDQNNPLVPAVLRTSVDANSAPLSANLPINNAVVPFLAFNDNVRERGFRSLWELHLAYYRGPLSLLGAWDAGHNDYALTGPGNKPVHLPVSGYFVQAAYILTGETLTDRVLIDPLHPFDLRPGRTGLGAWEVSARYSTLALGKQVFTQGLADPNLWTNQADLIDVGLNWYLNKWVKIYFDWERAIFAQPVYFRPGPERQKTNDLFWMRMQVYF